MEPGDEESLFHFLICRETIQAIACVARLEHSGKPLQVWGAEVPDEASGQMIALFRCTQIILWPKVGVV